VRYEFLLQPAVPGSPYDPEPAQAALVARGATVEPDGALHWKVAGERVEVRPLKEGGQVVATELHVPLAGDAAFVKAALEESLAVASEAGCRLFDPQLMRAPTTADAGAVALQYARTAKYAAEMVGAGDVLGSEGYSGSGFTGGSYGSTGGMSGQAKLFLAIAVLVALYLVVSGLSGALEGE
jgi:hypothetical protein